MTAWPRWRSTSSWRVKPWSTVTAALSTESMSARINWDTAEAYADAGAPTNGADYVSLGDGGLVTFDGPRATRRSRWSGPRTATGCTPARGQPRPVHRPEFTSRLTTRRDSVGLEYQTEQAWDFAFVQVYDEATEWISLPTRTPRCG